ncbi:hypothetical protein VHEMI06765 [[Torrubiella] hemipterigena]|uniref:Uncharacterized protein n=1 Tax=[Torrubiella] hemipterigena TaxID=1531966 RepID=A0A0A1TLN9_9HYPO|nr:hypothetical protein VHEMI06765 [[Torrubiella] hemipterigena]
MNILQPRRVPSTPPMSDLCDSDGRPAKRMRLGPSDGEARIRPDASLDTVDFAAAGQLDEMGFAMSFDLNQQQFDTNWRWSPSPSFFPAPNDMLLPMGPSDTLDPWAPGSPIPQILDALGTTVAPIPYDNQATIQPGVLGPASPPAASHDSKASFTTAEKKPARSLNEINPHNNQRRSQTDRFISPFKDCVDTFGTFNSPRFQRPSNGQINGYVKFNWVKRAQVEELADDAETSKERSTSPTSSQSTISTPSPGAAPATTTVSTTATPATTEVSNGLALERRSSSATLIDSPMSARSSFSFESGMPLPVAVSSGPKPRMVPPDFGHELPMDSMGRKLFRFYINNWCPGRSILKKSNLWLTDFAKMQGKVGVLAAIQSLAGIYIYDYQPSAIICEGVNRRFRQAEARLTDLLENADTLSSEDVNELVTISALLSMQDIVLVERRLRRPNQPRWLEGFKQSEYFLRKTDPGSRFWNPENVQMDELRLSQSIIVGRHVILAQPMTPLPNPDTFDYVNEVDRFGWLLYGTEAEMYEIHGGCGFSKRLLHTMSQVTCMAARQIQEPESPMPQMTAGRLLTVLDNVRQWSKEGCTWEVAQTQPLPITWISKTSDEYRIDDPVEMTAVTAEAWRLATVLYVQCRLLRLPRHHPDVILNLGYLAKCITIMPTSGSHFTAQAPLFPVFLLGLISTVPKHRAVAIDWFESVVETPVRSVSQISSFVYSIPVGSKKKNGKIETPWAPCPEHADR